MNERTDVTVELRSAKLLDELNRMWSQTELLMSAASTMQDRIVHIYESAGFDKPTTRVTVPAVEKPVRLQRSPLPPRWAK